MDHGNHGKSLLFLEIMENSWENHGKIVILLEIMEKSWNLIKKKSYF